MSGLSKLGTGLTVVFLACVLLLLAEIFYVLWCRRRSRRQNATVESDDSGRPYTTTTTTVAAADSSSSCKEQVYFFCWKKQSRIEPAAAPTTSTAEQEENDNPLKWHVLYGQSRLLFTIKEEDKEDLESEKSSSAERNLTPNTIKKKRVSLGECFEITQEEPSVAVDVENLQESTPFMTPCASPSSCTPSPSASPSPPRVAGEIKTESSVTVGVEVHGE